MIYLYRFLIFLPFFLGGMYFLVPLITTPATLFLVAFVLGQLVEISRETFFPLEKGK